MEQYNCLINREKVYEMCNCIIIVALRHEKTLIYRLGSFQLTKVIVSFTNWEYLHHPHFHLWKI